MKKGLILILLSCCVLNFVGCTYDEAKDTAKEKTDEFVDKVEENDISGKYINGVLGGDN